MRDPKYELRPWEARQRYRRSRRPIVVELLDDATRAIGIGQCGVGLSANDPPVVLVQDGREPHVAGDRLVVPADAVEEDEELDRNAEGLEPPGEPDGGAPAQALAVDHPAGAFAFGGRQRPVAIGIQGARDEGHGHVQAPVLERLRVPPAGGVCQLERHPASRLRTVVPSVQSAKEPDRYARARRNGHRARQIFELDRGAADREQRSHGCRGGEPDASHREPR
ncbi:MAG TPA: hypothetical protein VJ788_09130 [Gemmatimonadota bacterium]|nr:hypothetical protein [Gemmatimonadota bacterium]